jgi:hypothetical protein
MSTQSFELDPTIAADTQIMDEASSSTVTDYQAVIDAMEQQFGSDDLTDDKILSLIPQAAVLPPQALANTVALHKHDIWCGIGMCLQTVRMREFHVGALNPDAASAWFHGGRVGVRRHATNDPKQIPRGAVAYWLNGGHGHVAPCFGGALFGSTDIKRLGMVDFAYGHRISEWCGGELVGWAEILNGVDVWPEPDKKPDPFEPWTPARKIKWLRTQEAQAAREHHDVIAKQLAHWRERIEMRDKKN